MTTYVISYALSQGGLDRGALIAAITALADTNPLTPFSGMWAALTCEQPAEIEDQQDEGRQAQDDAVPGLEPVSARGLLRGQRSVAGEEVAVAQAHV
jgi:hypothetical protein